MKSTLFIVSLFSFNYCCCSSQIGPDPWDYETKTVSHKLSNDEIKVPPDLRATPKKITYTENIGGINDWFYKRILAIVLKGGQIKENDDDSVDVSLHMKFDRERWKLLNEYLILNKQFTDDMFRRSVGYIEESIFKPSLTEKIVLAWKDHIQFYLEHYKDQITWVLTLLTVKLGLIWLMRHISHKHMIIMSLAFLYLYEAFISYKEAEQQEVKRFLSAVNTCKWYIWSSSCDLPSPDPLIFLKYMNPLKIGIRMFTTLISEPMIIISDTMKTITHGITDGLWFPLDKIMYGILIVTFNTLLIFLLIMIIFNYILNIPFNLSFMGLLSIGLKQRNRNFGNANNSHTTQVEETNDRISGATLDKILDVCSRALSTVQMSQSNINQVRLVTTQYPTIRRSASTGRLPNYSNEINSLSNSRSAIEKTFEKNLLRKTETGSGDA